MHEQTIHAMQIWQLRADDNKKQQNGLEWIQFDTKIIIESIIRDTFPYYARPTYIEVTNMDVRDSVLLSFTHTKFL